MRFSRRIEVYYDGVIVGEHYADLLVEGVVINEDGTNV